MLTLVACALSAAQVFSAQFSIEAVKAAYLFRFASYVEWPESMNGDDPFIIGVIGAEDVAVHLEHLLNGMSVQGRAAQIRRVRTADDIEGLHILYVGANVFRSSRPLRLRVIEKPVLLVTDSRDGLEGGGVINFIEVNRNLRFEISLDAAQRSGLKIDSALLSVAARVDVRKK
ncbi:MAG TPA: YfiR family protein [Steroidobacteraceae bacterium]|nr:YfiR family protein [Steroidobacteraceae bacterium]